MNVIDLEGKRVIYTKALVAAPNERTVIRIRVKYQFHMEVYK